MPIIKKDSKKLIKLRCSFLSFVTRAMVANTETFTSAKPIPAAANKSLVIQKVFTLGITIQTAAIKPNATNIEFLYPILLTDDAIKKEVIAILKSLNASSTLAEPFDTSKLC